MIILLRSTSGVQDWGQSHSSILIMIWGHRLLLERSLRPHGAFELQDDRNRKGHDEMRRDETRRTRRLRGSLRRKMSPLATDDDVHHAIYFRNSKSAARLFASNCHAHLAEVVDLDFLFDVLII